MAQFWIAIFFILLAGAQLYQSVKDIALPFPVYLVLGTVLAVAANSRYKFGSIESERVTLPAIAEPTPTIAPTSSAPQIEAAETKVAPAAEPIDAPKLPDFRSPAPPTAAPIQSDKTAPKKPSRPRKQSNPKQPKQQP